MDQEFQNLVISTITSDADSIEQLGPTVKAVYRSGSQDACVEQLAAFVAKKEGEIEKMCNYHYQVRGPSSVGARENRRADVLAAAGKGVIPSTGEHDYDKGNLRTGGDSLLVAGYAAALRAVAVTNRGRRDRTRTNWEFVQSVDQLLKVRQGTVSVKNKIVNLNKQLQESGRKVVEKKQELMQYRQTHQNVETATEGLQSCLHVLELFNKANTHIENRKFYSALRILEELQTVHLNSVVQYEFARHMQECIPITRDNIKDAVTREMKEWLVSVREASRKVGKIAMDQTRKRQQVIKAKTRESVRSSQLLASSIELAFDDDVEANVIDNDQVKIEFKPLYQCLHIYDVLGKRPEFKQRYDADRKAQADLVLQQYFTLKDGDLSGLEKFFMDIIGLFIVEHVVMNSTTDFRSKAGVDMLWDAVTARVVSVISQSLQDCNDPDLFLALKMSLITFLQTLEGYEFSVAKLMEMLLALFERYSELTKMRISEKFHAVVEEDEYKPMVVKDEKEYEQVLEAFAFKEESRVSVSGFPRTLPFSRMFPVCCRDVKDFISGFYQFAEGFAQNFGEMDDILKKSLERLLVDDVNKVMAEKVQGNNFSQLSQIIVNFGYFELACGEFETTLATAQQARANGGRVALAATSAFGETKKKAEMRVFALINEKVDNFLEVAEYDFTPTQVQKAPSAYLQEMVGFLTSTMQHALANLPIQVKSLIYYDALNHLADSLMRLILDKNVKKMNSVFVENFNLDVTFLEIFVKNLKDPNLLDTFLVLRQAVMLLRSESYEEYLNPMVRNKKYSRLKPANVMALLEKLMRDKSAISLNQKDKSKRKSIELVMKQLKTMM